MPSLLSGNPGYQKFIKQTRRAGGALIDEDAPPIASTWKNPAAPAIPEGNRGILDTLAGGQGATSTTPWTRVADAERPVVANTLVRPNAAPVPAGESFTPPSEPAMVRPNAMPTPAPEPTFTPPPVSPTNADALYGNVLDQLSGALKSDTPLPGTQAQIQQQREALATYARNAEARAGAQAAKGGSFGQGTANQMANAVRGDILGELANTELSNTQLVSDEKQALLDKAIQAGQFGMNRDDRRAEFSATMAQRKDEFTKTFGQQEAASYLNQLERISLDNPVLAAKLTDHLLAGKTGAVGAFTPQELEQIKTYVSKKQGQQDKLTDVMNKVLEGLPAQIDKANNPEPTPAEIQAKAVDTAIAGKNLDTLTTEDWKIITTDANQLRKVQSSGLIKPNLAAAAPGEYAMVGNTPYKVLQTRVKRTKPISEGFGPLRSTGTETYYVTRVKNMLTGAEEDL